MVDFIDGLTKDGGYASASEVVRDGLRLLRREQAIEEEKEAILRREIDIGLKAAAEGNFSKKTVSEIADEVRREHGGAYGNEA